MATFFTSDTHFGHKNIINYCDRPFDSVEEMDLALTENWNDTVGPDDVVYHLGDLSFGTSGYTRQVFSRLNGCIRVLGLPWHHDKGWLPRRGAGLSTFLSKSGHPVEILLPVHVYRCKLRGKRRVITLSHYPMAQWEASHHGHWHIHGHSHGTHTAEGAVLDVGVDCCDYRPVALADLPDLIPDAVTTPQFG
jgi:calcineurin-like phosphoesterase family protein